MNKFVVFAVLAACAFAQSMFPTLENHHRNVRDDDVEFDPHPLPCSYAIMFHQKASAFIDGEWINFGNASGTYFKHDKWLKVMARGHSLNHTHTMIEQLYRNDIKDEETGKVYAFYANLTESEDSCNYDLMTQEEMAERVNQTLELFITKTKYQKKESGKFGDIDCTLYINENEEDKSISTIFVNGDNYIIGANYTKYFDFGPTSGSSEFGASGSGSGASGSGSGASGSGASGSSSPQGILIQMIATVTYRHYAVARDFVIIQNITGKCLPSAYIRPEEPLCYVELTPPKAPCAFEIHVQQKTTMNGTEVGSAEQDFYVHGTYAKMHQHIMRTGEPEVTIEYVIRPDLIVSGNVTVYGAYKDTNESTCETETYAPEYIAGMVAEYLYLYVNTTKHEYETTYEYEGKTYKAYVDYVEHFFGEGTVNFVVDENNLIFLIDMQIPGHRGSYGAKVTIEYKDYTPLSNFVIDKNVGPNCTDYNAPTNQICPEPVPSTPSGSTASSTKTSSTSMASTSTVAVAMTLLSVAVIALL